MGAYVGIDGKAKKVNNIYIGVDNVAKKATKGYVGVGGVARPFWSGGGKPLEYYGRAKDLQSTRSSFAGASLGEYGLFGGGYIYSAAAHVDVYSSSLVRTTATNLRSTRYFLAGASVGDYGLFGGGINEADLSDSGVDAYDKNLVCTKSTALSNARAYLAGVSVGAYALFGGGERYAVSGSDAHYADVDAYTQEGAGFTTLKLINNSSSVIQTACYYRSTGRDAEGTSLSIPQGDTRSQKLSSNALYLGVVGGSTTTTEISPRSFVALNKGDATSIQYFYFLRTGITYTITIND